MKKTRMKTIALAALALMAGAAFATPEISNVTAKQRYPWNGKVDITFEVSGDPADGLPADMYPALVVSAIDNAAGTTNIAVEAALSGGTGWEEGPHHVVWDLDAQGAEIVSKDVVFSVEYRRRHWLYCVVDLSAGAEAESYPVAYTNEPPEGGFNTEEYKTSKLVLRRIDAGSFMMNGKYDVTLTKPYYMALFEMTQKQYELVTGEDPSDAKGAMRPVESVSWNAVRGDLSGTTFMGMMRAKTSLNFDLPTEAQWEYACRAGTTSEYNNGGDSEDDLEQLGRYDGNISDGTGGFSDGHTTVGSYLPNVWGLYDMHGNVNEWCFDINGNLAGGTDPTGGSSGSYRMVRGGNFYSDADACTSSYRSQIKPALSSPVRGFRLSRLLGETGAVICKGEIAEAVPVDSRKDSFRETSADEMLSFSSLWEGVEGAKAKIAWEGGEDASVTNMLNGVLVANGAELEGEGDLIWHAENGTYVLTHTTFKGEDVVKVETATFVVKGRNVAFSGDEVTVEAYDSNYDGAAHGITVTSALPGFKVKYAPSNVEGTAPDGEFGDDSPTLTDAGSITVWYEISAPWRLVATNSATVTISKREVTLTSGSDSKVYDGIALTNHVVSVGGDGFVDGEGADYDFAGSQTAVGTSDNSFSYTLKDGTKADNYTISTEYGTLEVTPKSLTDESVTINVEGGSTYNGGEQVPTVTVADGTSLTEADYEVEYVNNTNASEYAMAIVTGKGNYMCVVTNMFTIAPKDIAGATVALGAELTYNGEEQTQDVTSVTVDELDVTYEVSGNKATTAGVHTLTVTGTGNFTGTATKEFTILRADIDHGVTSYDGIYDGEGHGIEVSVTMDTDDEVRKFYSLAEAGPYSAEPILFTNVMDEVTVWYVVEADNYNTVTNSGTVKISLAEITQEVAPYEGTYDGKGHGITVNVTMTTGDEVRKFYALAEAGPYSAEPILFTNVTDSTVWYVVEADNYIAVTNSGTVKISQKKLTQAMVTVTGGVLGEEDVKVEVADGDPSILAESDYDVAIESRGVGDVVVTVTGKGNYTGKVVKDSGISIPGEGTVTAPKTLKPKQKATWKATAAKGSVFAHWEGEFVESLGLSWNELRNPSLQFVVPEGDFDTNAIQAVFISIDSDRLSELTLSQTELEPNVEVAGLELGDDSESYLTASVSGLPTGLKFNAKTLAITGKPTKPGVYTVKITAKNASGYQWAENVEMRVADIEDGRIDFSGLPAEAAVGEEYEGQISAGEFKTLKASGLPAGLKFDAKTGKVAGKPTKGGYFTVAVAATYADKTKAEATYLMTVTPVPSTPDPKRTPFHPLTTISSDPEMGTATGTGVYAEGKKVSISAKAAKNCVFAGWYLDAELTEQMTFASGDFRKASQSVVVPEVRYIFAKFVTSEEDKGSIELTVNNESFEVGAIPSYTNYCGVAVDWPVAADALSEPKVKAAGLPAGVKLVQDKKTGAYSLAGAPTAASKADKSGNLAPSKVKLTVTTAGKSTQVYEFDWTILPLPAWAAGTFDGAVFDAADETGIAGLVSALTVAANGKISGKILESGKTWTLSAASFESVDEGENLAFRATAIAKAGKEVSTNEIVVAAENGVGVLAGAAEDGRLPEWKAWQNLWKTEPWKTDAKPFAKATALALYVVKGEGESLAVVDALEEGVSPYGTLTLKFAASGVATASAKFVTGQDAKGKDVVYSASCSAPLVPESGNLFNLVLYFPPKAGKFDGYATALPLVWDGASFTLRKAE